VEKYGYLKNNHCVLFVVFFESKDFLMPGNLISLLKFLRSNRFVYCWSSTLDALKLEELRLIKSFYFILSYCSCLLTCSFNSSILLFYNYFNDFNSFFFYWLYLTSVYLIEFSILITSSFCYRLAWSSLSLRFDKN